MKKLLVVIFSLSLFSVNAQDVVFRGEQENHQFLRDTYRDSLIVEFQILLNDYRKSLNKQPIINYPEWNKRCNKWSEYQLKIGAMTHERPDSVLYDFEKRAETYPGNATGIENCTIFLMGAVTATPYECAAAAFFTWKDSYLHNINMLDGSSKTFGLGFSIQPNGWVYVTFQTSYSSIDELQ